MKQLLDHKTAGTKKLVNLHSQKERYFPHLLQNLLAI